MIILTNPEVLKNQQLETSRVVLHRHFDVAQLETFLQPQIETVVRRALIGENVKSGLELVSGDLYRFRLNNPPSGAPYGNILTREELAAVGSHVCQALTDSKYKNAEFSIEMTNDIFKHKITIGFAVPKRRGEV